MENSHAKNKVTNPTPRLQMAEYDLKGAYTDWKFVQESVKNGDKRAYPYVRETKEKLANAKYNYIKIKAEEESGRCPTCGSQEKSPV